ncbi:MAG: phosphoglucomutase/phosphomannomutase family protein [Dehalococcoidia bacterium]
MSESPIRFGTDGWRAIIADEFTFENVRACAAATADHFAETRGTAQPVVVGYDTRFMSDVFALEVARVVAGRGFRVQLASRPAPTPALSYRIIEIGGAGGLVVTSSHNPYNWNGIKVKPHYGGSASPGIVADIERRVPAMLANPSSIAREPESSPRIERFDPVPGYLAGLGKQVDLDRIRDAGLHIAVDPMYGTAAGLYGALVGGGRTRLTEVHGEQNPNFPGIRAPEPIAPNLGELLALAAQDDVSVGIANDGDADRFGLVDERGRYMDQLRTFAVLVHYLLGERGLRGPIVRSITTTNMANLLAKHYGVECLVTPVGFKHIGPLMMERDALIGGEESGGYGFRGHLPERDGVLSGLFLLDYLASTGATPSELLARVFAITGEHFYERVDIELDPDAKERVRAALDTAAPAELAGQSVREKDTTDGWRFVFDEGWLLFRLSGTEPLLRIYTEVRDASLVKPMLDAGRRLASA